MLQFNKHKHQNEINSTYKEINDWLKENKFQECFRNQQNHQTEFHWIKNGVRICLHLKHISANLEKHLVIHNDVLVFADTPFAVKSMKYSIDQKSKILEIHKKFARMQFSFINESELNGTFPVEHERTRGEIENEYNMLCHKYRKAKLAHLVNPIEVDNLDKQLDILEEKYPYLLERS